jgi:hypothetical protein
MMREVILDRSYHHLVEEIVVWCFNNIGPGGRKSPSAPMEWTWDFDQIFGYTTIRFRRDNDWVLFMLTWK